MITTGFLDDALVEAYCTTFLGYGNSHSPFWFIGKEDGGAETFSEAATRLTIWHQRGQQCLEDCAQYHWAIGEYRWHGHPTKHQKIKLQPTWTPFITIRLSTESAPPYLPSSAALAQYQQERLGRLNGSDCVIDLLPFPMHQWCTSPLLSKRKQFEDWIIPIRKRKIATLLKEQNLVNVIFFGAQQSYIKRWQEIAQAPLSPTDVTYQYGGSPNIDRHVLAGRRGQKNFVVLPQPNARIKGEGAREKLWQGAADILR
jgi:hypothetical protein